MIRIENFDKDKRVFLDSEIQLRVMHKQNLHISQDEKHISCSAIIPCAKCAYNKICPLCLREEHLTQYHQVKRIIENTPNFDQIMEESDRLHGIY